MASAPETSFQSKQTNNKFISLEKNQIKSNKSIFPTLTLTLTHTPKFKTNFTHLQWPPIVGHFLSFLPDCCVVFVIAGQVHWHLSLSHDAHNVHLLKQMYTMSASSSDLNLEIYQNFATTAIRLCRTFNMTIINDKSTDDIESGNIRQTHTQTHTAIAIIFLFLYYLLSMPFNNIQRIQHFTHRCLQISLFISFIYDEILDSCPMFTN